MSYSISVTTRPIRRGESDGRDYYFVDRGEFERMKKGRLVEWAEVHGHLYGTPKKFLDDTLARGLDVVLDIDVQGGVKVKEAFPHAVMVFILPPSWQELERRIRERGTDEAVEVSKRLENAKREMAQAFSYDYLVVNDELERVAAELRAIIKAERCRKERYDRGLIERLMAG